MWLEEGISLVETRTFWMAVVTAVIWILQQIGVDTHTIDQGSVANFFVSVAGGVSIIGVMIARYFAKAPVTSILPKAKP
jgi:uncharacterized membrane protein